MFMFPLHVVDVPGHARHRVDRLLHHLIPLLLRVKVLRYLLNNNNNNNTLKQNLKSDRKHDRLNVLEQSKHRSHWSLGCLNAQSETRQRASPLYNDLRSAALHHECRCEGFLPGAAGGI